MVKVNGTINLKPLDSATSGNEGDLYYDSTEQKLKLHNGTEFIDVGSTIGFVPVGTILPWHKSLTGTPTLPEQFAECNGQTISDPDSPYNGQTLPDLNGNNYFLRGNSSSGTTGGTLSHSFAQASGSTHWPSDSGHYYAHKLTINGTTIWEDHTENNTGETKTVTIDNQPPFMDIVWIIRIK